MIRRLWWLVFLLSCQPAPESSPGRDARWTLTDYLHALEARKT